ncbi:MAG: hypothetical protein L6V93_13255 [Clostridiales bacterium]|nr:MAG: hypothetical protein L6V93_13255 [Clostridiales bacterium]
MTEEEMNGLTTPVSNVPSTEGFMVNGVNTMIADTPAKYIFKPASSDTKSYILLKNVNAGENDGYFVMVQDGGLRADTADSAIAKLKSLSRHFCRRNYTSTYRCFLTKMTKIHCILFEYFGLYRRSISCNERLHQ